MSNYENDRNAYYDYLDVLSFEKYEDYVPFWVSNEDLETTLEDSFFNTDKQYMWQG